MMSHVSHNGSCESGEVIMSHVSHNGSCESGEVIILLLRLWSISLSNPKSGAGIWKINTSSGELWATVAIF